MYQDRLNPILDLYAIDATIIIHLVEQGVELERLKLEVNRCTHSDSVETRINVLQGERFIHLLRTGWS